MLKPNGPVWLALLLTQVPLGAPAFADATSSLPKQFQSDTYIEADYEDFCSSQSSSRKCITITIKNESRATLDVADDSLDGSALGSGALEGFQVFEAPGCITRNNLPGNTRQHVPEKSHFTRRMRQENLHYWRPGREKDIKVLQGCAYAVAVKRKEGKHHWHFSYVPPTAKAGCRLDYRYVTNKADIKSYEKWATFGAIGGGAEAVLAGVTAGSAAAYYLTYDSILTVSDVLLESTVIGAMPAVFVLGAAAAYEAGLWGAYGIDAGIHVIDGKRDFLLGEHC